MKKNKITRYGKWAIVTGASSGIGQEFARQLHAKGMKIVLAARSLGPLEEMAKELGQDKTQIIAIDLAESGAADRLDAQTKDIDVGLIVHSAGIAHMGPLLELDDDTLTNLKAIHIDATVDISRIFGQRLKRRGEGGIILVSSGLAFSPVPYGAVYGAAKAFILSFGEALAEELRSSKIDVLTVVPGGTKTNMAEHLNSLVDLDKLKMPMGNPADVARAGIAALGQRDTIIPGSMNKIMAVMMSRIMSRKMSKSMIGGMMKTALRTQPE